MTHESDAALVRVLTEVAEKVIAPEERPYDIAIDAMGAIGGVLTEARHAGVAYMLWAEISDLLDAPRGPESEEMCDAYARAAATDWLAVDATSPEAVTFYFDRWEPGSGSAWVAQGDL